MVLLLISRDGISLYHVQKDGASTSIHANRFIDDPKSELSCSSMLLGCFPTTPSVSRYFITKKVT